MKRLQFRVFAGSELELVANEVIGGDVDFSVGSALAKSVSKIPSISIDNDKLPPFFVIAQFKGGELWLVHNLEWLAVDENGVIRPRCAVDLQPAPGGKLAFEIPSRQHGICRIELEVKE